jgi:signal peptidase I
MRVWARPLRSMLGAAAALALAAMAVTRYGVVFVGGWSMSPACTPGDVAVYARAPVRVQEREIVLVAVPGTRPFVHRVLAVQVDGSLRTKGDACPSADLVPCRPRDVGGLVTCVVPTGRALHALVGAVRWCYNHVPIANTRR